VLVFNAENTESAEDRREGEQMILDGGFGALARGSDATSESGFEPMLWYSSLILGRGKLRPAERIHKAAFALLALLATFIVTPVRYAALGRPSHNRTGPRPVMPPGMTTQPMFILCSPSLGANV